MRIALLLFCWAVLTGATFQETPYLREQVESGSLPPVEKRLPSEPAVEDFSDDMAKAGEHGGTLNILMAKANDVRQMVVYGYSRLVGYNHKLELHPDILAGYEVEEGRIFTLRLRPGHRWSDGAAFTAEDFRYWWEDMANNPELSPSGPPIEMLVEGELPEVAFLDEHTIRYTWPAANPSFIPALAGARPMHIYAPAHYLKQFHERYQGHEKLAAMVADSKRRNWAALHNRLDNQYGNENPDLPSLEPWVNTTGMPSERFVFKRNPYYHRVDPAGRQLPYIDEVIMSLAAAPLIPAKAGSGESDLQARYLSFSNISFLKQNEAQYGFNTMLWRTGKGAHLALFPNLNHEDPVWRELFRDVRFRRAMSMAVNRHEINQVIFYGYALETGNSLLPDSPLYDAEREKRWTKHDPAAANRLLDEIGLARVGTGVRRLPDGRALEIVVETAGESTEQTDVLELVSKSFMQVGIKLHSKPLQREVLRNRVFAGQTQIAIWSGLENGMANEQMSPAELAPTSQQHLQWPRWGQYRETKGQAGAPIDMEKPQRLYDLYHQWRKASADEERREIWEEMLDIWSDEVYTIGLVSGVLQPVVATTRLQNLPTEGFFNWDPGAHFGVYRPDRFWLSKGKKR